jgi:hypothetical protein
MLEIISDKCLLEADPLDIQLKLGSASVAIVICKKCHTSCLATTRSDRGQVGLELYFAGDEDVDGAAEMANACKSKNDRVKQFAKIAISAIGEASIMNRGAMPWVESGFGYTRLLTDPDSQIYFIEPKLVS